MQRLGNHEDSSDFLDAVQGTTPRGGPLTCTQDAYMDVYINIYIYIYMYMYFFVYTDVMLHVFAHKPPPPPHPLPPTPPKKHVLYFRPFRNPQYPQERHESGLELLADSPNVDMASELQGKARRLATASHGPPLPVAAMSSRPGRVHPKATDGGNIPFRATK